MKPQLSVTNLLLEFVQMKAMKEQIEEDLEMMLIDKENTEVEEEI